MAMVVFLGVVERLPAVGNMLGMEHDLGDTKDLAA